MKAKIPRPDARIKTLEGEFAAGMESGKFPCLEHNRKAVQAVATKLTPALVRAYWTGYLCQVQGQGDLSSLAL